MTELHPTIFLLRVRFPESVTLTPPLRQTTTPEPLEDLGTPN